MTIAASATSQAPAHPAAGRWTQVGAPLRAGPVSTGLRTTCVAAIVVGVVAALRFFALRGSLWEDELIAITHANQPLPSFFVELLRNDIHPPLYFLQLDAWLALGANSDRWALANSLLWAAISIATVFFVARALNGARAAWIATALFAVLPSTVWSAGTLRMYAAIPACILLVYFANRRWFDARAGAWLLAVFAAEVLLAYVHAVEFYFVAFAALAAFAEAVGNRRMRVPSLRFSQSVRMWLIVQVLVGLCVLPLAGSALLRGSDAAAPDTARTMLTVGGALVAGWKTSGIGWLRAVGTVIFVALVGCGIAARDSRVRTVVMPVGALLAAMLISLFFKPIFKQPVFAANLLPFVVLGAGVAADRFDGARILVMACLALLAAAAVPLVPLLAQGEAYAAAAHSVRERARPGDVVVVPNVSVFWGVVRYAIGPSWGQPLSILPPPNPEWERLNERIAKTLGPDAPRRLGLVPERDFVDADGVRYVLGQNVAAETAAAGHVWLVTRERYQADVRLGPQFAPSEVVGPETFGNGELLVRRFDRVPS